MVKCQDKIVCNRHAFGLKGIRVNDAGLLCLMVSDPLAMNMSNTLGYLRGELIKEQPRKKPSFCKRVLELAPVKKVLLAVYNRIFNCYYS
jgi:hypothetical protein